jgi:hypothetical protein
MVSECYKRLLSLGPEELQEYRPKNAAEAIALRQVISGIYGQDALPSAKEITDRTEGKAPQSLQLKVSESDDAAKWQEIAEHLSAQFGVPIEQVRRDLAAQKPELASTLLQ